MTDPFMERLVRTRLADATYKYPGWEEEIGERRGFRLLGQTWFKRTVTSNIGSVATNANEVIRKVLGEDAKLPQEKRRWHHPGFQLLKDNYSSKQLYEAFDQKPLIFRKAIESIILCGVAADEVKSEVTFEDVLENMSLEPAFSYIYGFTPHVISIINAANPGFLERLKTVTGQNAVDIFSHMANGQLVTGKLAIWVRQAIVNDADLIAKIKASGLEIGDVLTKPKSGCEGQKYTKRLCNENFDIAPEDVAKVLNEQKDKLIKIDSLQSTVA